MTETHTGRRDETFVSTDLLACHLGLPLTWLRGECDDGRIPYVQAGARRRFDVDQVRECLREQAARKVVHVG